MEDGLRARFRAFGSLIEDDTDPTLFAMRRFDKNGVLEGHRKLREAVERMDETTRASRAVAQNLPFSIDQFCKPINNRSGVEGMRRIKLGQLGMNKWHRNMYLRGFLRGSAFRYVKLPLGVFEDETGKAARLVLKAYYSEDLEDPTLLLPQDAEVIIKEPCLVRDYAFRGTYLWVANPACFTVVSYYPNFQRSLDASDTLDASKFRSMGNEQYIQQNFLAAVDLYSRAIEISQKSGNNKADLLLAFSNRSESWLKLQRYERAFADADKALELEPMHAKSSHRKVRALWGLHLYHEAFTFMEERKDKNLAGLEGVYEKAELFDRQSRFGIHDISNYYLENCTREATPELADYIGPVKIGMSVNGTGRGLFLTEDVKKGDLLFVDNAMSLVRLENKEGVFRPEDIPQEELAMRMVSKVVNRCLDSSRTLARMYTLGESENCVTNMHKVLEKGVPSMKLFRPNWDRSGTEKEVAFDMVRLFNIVPSNMDFEVVRAGTYNGGTWALVVFMNHSCLPNVSVRRVGEAKLVYAVKDMKAGTELLRSYARALQPKKNRDETHFEFICVCPRCKLEIWMEKPLAELTKSYDELTSKKLSVSVIKGFVKLAIQLEKMMHSLVLTEEQQQWFRAAYAEAYSWYYADSYATPNRVNPPDMPPVEEVIESFHKTAPGDQDTLDFMIRCKLGESGSLRAVDIWKEECVAYTGRLDDEVLNALIKLSAEVAIEDLQQLLS